MSKKTDKNLIVALDIGTSKIAALVGEINENGQIEIKANYINGLLDGEFISFFENGQLCVKRHYQNGKATGDYISYFEKFMEKADKHNMLFSIEKMVEEI